MVLFCFLFVKVRQRVFRYFDSTAVRKSQQKSSDDGAYDPDGWVMHIAWPLNKSKSQIHGALKKLKDEAHSRTRGDLGERVGETEENNDQAASKTSLTKTQFGRSFYFDIVLMILVILHFIIYALMTEAFRNQVNARREDYENMVSALNSRIALRESAIRASSSPDNWFLNYRVSS